MFPDDLSTFPVVQTCSLLGRWIPFPTSPCVKSELGTLPGSLRSKAPEHFSDSARHLFIFTTRDARTTDKTNEKRILKGSWDSHQLPALTQPQMYMCGCHFGIWCTYPDFNPFFFPFFFRPTEETSLLHHIWSVRWQPRSLFTTRFLSVTNNTVWKPLS